MTYQNGELFEPGHPKMAALAMALDQELPPAQAAEIAAHLANCNECSARLAGWRQATTDIAALHNGLVAPGTVQSSTEPLAPQGVKPNGMPTGASLSPAAIPLVATGSSGYNKGNIQMSSPGVQPAPAPGNGNAAPVGPNVPPNNPLPTLFGEGYGTYGVKRGSFVASYLLVTLMAAGIVYTGKFAVDHKEDIKKNITALVTDISPYVLQPSKTKAGGGGGGGDHDKIEASKGSLPKFAKEQFTPPVRVIRNPNPVLPMEATVVVPPTIKIASNMPVIGDPFSHNVNGPESNGTGTGGGIGSGSGGGIGSGTGPGVGPGRGGGIGGGVYSVGGGVSAPKAIFAPDPEYSDEARKAKYQGVVDLSCVVGADGRVRDCSPVHTLGMGLDEKAIEGVKTWKFEPARKDGTPVPVRVLISVNYRLY